MNQHRSLPIETFPLYRIINGDTIGELEDNIADLFREYETAETVVGFLAGPKLIKEDDDLYWIQPVLIEVRHKNYEY